MSRGYHVERVRRWMLLKGRSSALGIIDGDTKAARLSRSERSGAEGWTLLRALGRIGRGEGRAFDHWL